MWAINTQHFGFFRFELPGYSTSYWFSGTGYYNSGAGTFSGTVTCMYGLPTTTCGTGAYIECSNVLSCVEGATGAGPGTWGTFDIANVWNLSIGPTVNQIW